MRHLFLAMSIIATPAFASNGDPMLKYRSRIMALTPDDAARKIVVQDDDLALVAQINSEKIGRTKGHVTMGEGDVMLRAGVNKRTGRTLYEVTGAIGYWGEWRYYSLAEYSSPDGPQQADLRSLARNVIACMAPAGCKLQEVVTLDISEEMLRKIAAGDQPWRFRFSGNGPQQWNEEMSPVEVQAFLATVDSYKRSKAIVHP